MACAARPCDILAGSLGSPGPRFALVLGSVGNERIKLPLCIHHTTPHVTRVCKTEQRKEPVSRLNSAILLLSLLWHTMTGPMY
jgi:hypothetical protein